VVVLHEVLAWWRGGPEIRTPGRWRVALAFLVVGGAYLLFYRFFRSSGVPIMKDMQGLVFLLIMIPKSLGLYSAVWTMGLPVSALYEVDVSWLIPAIAVAGLVFGVLVIRFVRKLVRWGTAAPFFLLWTVLFLALALLTTAEPRALSVATVGWSYLLAGLLLPRNTDALNMPRWFRYGLLTANPMLGVCWAVLTMVVGTFSENRMQDVLREYVEVQSAGKTPIKNGDALIISEPKSSMEIMLAGDRLEFITGLRDVSVAYLTVTGTKATVTRPDDRTLSVASRSPLLFNSRLHQLALGPYRRFQVGETFRTREFTAEIAAIEDGRVTELRIRFNEPLTSTRLHFHPPELGIIAHGGPATASTPAAPTRRGPPPASSQ